MFNPAKAAVLEAQEKELPEIYGYTIPGRFLSIHFTQNELTLKNDWQIVKLYTEFTKRAPGADVPGGLGEIFKALSETNLLKAFLNIILTPKKDWRFFLSLEFVFYYFRGVDINRLTNSELEQIFRDFFLLNQNLIARLMKLINVSELIQRVILSEPTRVKKQSKPKP